jgi:hypothetical protein
LLDEIDAAGGTMSYWIERDERPRWVLFVTGCVAGAVVVGLVWIIQWWATDEATGNDPPVQAAEASVGATRNAAPERSADRLSRCREVFHAQDAPLRAAEPSLSQWQIHIGAMNKLVTGVITLDQATQFWDETRVAAARLLDQYADATQQYDQRTVRCPRTNPTTLSTGEARCAAAVAARGLQLQEASVALATWRTHVHHMEMLRTGEMTPEEATQLWLVSWHQGAQELRSYDAAARAARGKTC